MPPPTRVVLIDNYDSFTWNLQQYMAQLGADVVVVRNDQIDVAGVRALAPDRIMISPGPGAPADAGVSTAVLRAFAGELPLFGVCLGHQCIYEMFGGTVARSGEIWHGKTSPMAHDGRGIFAGLDPAETFAATRYHSLVGTPETLPDELEVCATVAGTDMIQAVRHKTMQIHGVQFHPESVATEHGMKMVENFLLM